MKILIVEDQISIQFEIVELIQTYLKAVTNNILLANNGLEAIKVVEKDDIDIILMDNEMPIIGGIEASKIINHKYPQIKIIIITNNYDEILLKKSIDIGAKGYLLKQNISPELISEIYNLMEDNINFIYPKINHTIEDISNEIIPSKSMSKILKIDKIIASIILEEWTYNKIESSLNQEDFFEYFSINLKSKDDITNLLIRGDSSKCSLVDELDLRLKNLVSKFLDGENLTNNQTEKVLDLIISQLTSWFYNQSDLNSMTCFQIRLQANAQVLRVNCIKEIKKFIDSFIFKISPNSSLEYLELLESILNVIAQKYQRELNDLEQQERSARQAYNILFDINFQSNSQYKKIEEFNSLIRAISHIYHIKIINEVNNLAIQIIQGIIRIIQFYIDDLILTINLLEKVQYQLDISNINQNLVLFVREKYFSFQNPNNLLADIEYELGYSINQWGVKYDNPELILNKLFQKISIHSTNILESVHQELTI